MDLSYKQEVTVGGLVLVAIVLFIVGTTWLSGRSIGGKSSDYWHVQFHDVAGLKVSSAVRVSGVAVGRVEEIKLLEPGKVLVGVSLKEGVVPRTDASATVASIGFVGDAVVDLDPGRAAQPRAKSDVIIGSVPVGLMDRAAKLSDRADSVLIGVQALANPQMAQQMQATLVALQGTLKATQRTMAFYGDPNKGPTATLNQTMASLQQTMTSFQHLGARLDSTLGNPALARTLARSDTLTKNLAAMTVQSTTTLAHLDSTLTLIRRGQGTLGKFATDSAVYYHMDSVAQSLKLLMDDIRKHPGKISPTIKLF